MTDALFGTVHPFYDCNCNQAYIHFMPDKQPDEIICGRCGITAEEAPNSRADEILKSDWAVHIGSDVLDFINLVKTQPYDFNGGAMIPDELIDGVVTPKNFINHIFGPLYIKSVLSEFSDIQYQDLEILTAQSGIKCVDTVEANIETIKRNVMEKNMLIDILEEIVSQHPETVNIFNEYCRSL